MPVRRSTPPPRPKSILVVIRHAHRDKPQGGRLDNGLSSRGLEQASHLVQALSQDLRGKKIWIRTSPKLRCRETVQPLAERHKAKVVIESSLNEGSSAQASFRSLVKWVQETFDKNAKQAWLICSHGDLIPELTQLLCGSWIDLSKGGYAVFEFTQDGTQAELRSVKKP